MMPDESGCCVIEGEALDHRLTHHCDVYRNCLQIALSALRFDRSPATVQAVRRIQKLLTEAGIRSVEGS